MAKLLTKTGREKQVKQFLDDLIDDIEYPDEIPLDDEKYPNPEPQIDYKALYEEKCREIEILKKNIQQFRIVNYSDKAFAVYGDTKQFYQDFKFTCRGLWNQNLKDGPGWIFQNKFREQVESIITK